MVSRETVAKEFRELAHLLAKRNLDDATAESFVHSVKRWKDRLAAFPCLPDVELDAIRESVLSSEPDDIQMSHPAHCFVAGAENPIGLGLSVSQMSIDRVHGVACLGPAHEGAPGRAHGGITAAIFDDLFSHVASAAGELAMTGRLEVTYLGPVPILTRLAMEGYVHSRSGRRMEVGGKLVVEGNKVASASATMICI